MGAAHASTSSDPGLILGRYRPLRPLGSGGSASVWLAHDSKEDREVALKIVRREGKAAARAEREVDAAARLRHPRCLRVLALDRDDDHVYVAYEYVRGRTLREALGSGEMSDRDAVEAAAQILEGLAHAHGKRVVHRDVKPANVMLDEGDAISVRLLDFGLAHLEEAETLTAVGDVPGTLTYVSPERLAGRQTTAAADVWATGVVLWEALAGWHPFASSSPIETARRIREGAQPLATLRPDLPADLCTLVDRMLDLDPRRRPAAKQLPRALRDAFAETQRRPRPAASLTSLRGRAVHAGLTADLRRCRRLRAPVLPERLALRPRCARRRARAALAALRVRPRPRRAGLPAGEHRPGARRCVRGRGRGVVRALLEPSDRRIPLPRRSCARAGRRDRPPAARAAARRQPRAPGRNRRHGHARRGDLRHARRRAPPVRRQVRKPRASPRRPGPTSPQGRSRAPWARSRASSSSPRSWPPRR